MVKESLNSNWNRLGFTNHLEALNMIRKEDLKIGEIYCHEEWITRFIGFDGSYIKEGGSIDENHFYKTSPNWGSITSFLSKDIRIATNKEKHHLLECIKLNKFISFEEAIKTFNKEINYEIY